jgi:hypothetical protein
VAKLLVVDDEANIRTLIKKYAQYEGYEIIEAVNGIDAVAKCRTEDFDLIVMDVMMPELDGFSAVREIRKNKNIPVIMLSARGEEYDRIHGFEVGVDDYVVKPFSPRELMMRIAALLRRSGKDGEDESDVVDYGDLAIDFRGRFVYVLGRRVEMSPKEYDLLFYLAKNVNVALSREKLITEVWGYDYYGDDRTLDTHIKLLRRSLGEAAGHIVTLRGVGYRFEA